jgi:predicted nucleotidyltransferase
VGELDRRRRETESRFLALQQDLQATERLAGDVACVYATGSFGRGEASSHSDLDLFILGKVRIKFDAEGRPTSERLLRRLDEICIKADLIQATKNHNIPEFSGDGRYLTHYTVDELIGKLGGPDDDVANTFTARLLLLLESRPLVGGDVYGEVIGDVIAKYWRDFEDHKSNFVPAFLANDILRLWRTFCVNYEARTERVPEDKKAKGKLKNYKLKHSRLLTCYSALLYVLAIYRRHGAVTPQDALKMVEMTPTERLEWLRDQPDFEKARPTVKRSLDRYERFLETTDAAEEDLLERVRDKATSERYMREAREFGDTVFDALHAIGGDSPFYRLLVV